MLQNFKVGGHVRFPSLVRKEFCKTEATLKIEQEGLNVYGEPLDTIEITSKCNYQGSAKTVLTADKKLIQLSGTALFIGDICPTLPEITGGSIAINGVERTIFSSQKHRNPDGTVNYTEISIE